MAWLGTGSARPVPGGAVIPRGAQPLINLRQQGKRPAKDVWIEFGDYPNPDWHRWAETQFSPSLVVLPTDPIDRLDLRCIVGLRVILCLDTWTEKSSLLYERVIELAAEVAVLCPDFGEDIGWWHVPKYGRIEWDQRHYLTKLEEVHGDRTAAAHRRDDQTYKLLAAREDQILKEAPWLRF